MLGAQVQRRPCSQSWVQPLLVQFSWRSWIAHHTSPPTIVIKQIIATIVKSVIV